LISLIVEGQVSQPSIADVRRIGKVCSNWGRWRADDELGTLNLITPESVRAGAASVELGEVISLGLPFNSAGPQNGGFGRFNPIHLMIRDGNDAVANTTVRADVDGTVFQAEVAQRLDYPGRPLDDAQVMNKFMDCVTRGLDVAAAMSLWTSVEEHPLRAFHHL
jgi:hypothetical protein